MGKKGDSKTEESVSSHELNKRKLGKLNAAGPGHSHPMLDDLKASIWRCWDEIIGVHEYNVNAQQAVQWSATVAKEGALMGQRNTILHKDNVFYTWILGCSCPKAVSAAACVKDCWTVQWSLGPVQDLQCEKVNFIGQGCTQISSCFLCTIVEGTSMKTYAKYKKKKENRKSNSKDDEVEDDESVATVACVIITI